jgi:hypothetical protein
MPECAGSPACIRCRAPLTRDEIVLTKKLINRGCTEFLCYTCLAAHFQVTVEDLLRKVEEFREMGCTLFL